ncbi:hypothetical protein F5Y12DRAFT_377048 [Xylaria sp. FL1777]|nr:hypothetical protein F5Y12DRAFT_377048 [Xylaria sp. FL1777]
MWHLGFIFGSNKLFDSLAMPSPGPRFSMSQRPRVPVHVRLPSSQPPPHLVYAETQTDHALVSCCIHGTHTHGYVTPMTRRINTYLHIHTPSACYSYYRAKQAINISSRYTNIGCTACYISRLYSISRPLDQ